MPNYLWVLCGPCGEGKVGESLKRRVGKPRQDVGEVVAHWDLEAATAFNHGEDRGYTRPGLFTSDVDPVFSTQGNSPDILPMSVKN